MSYFIGQIELFAGNFAPAGTAFCEGQLMAISSNDALFSLIGTIYGGDGRTTFALPDLRGRVAVHQGTGPGLSHRTIGSRAGEASVVLNPGHIPAHTHTMRGRNHDKVAANSGVLAKDLIYGPPDANMVALGPLTIDATPASSSVPHNNEQPNTALRYIIALAGVYPSRN